ncbi:C40 family peptidase [Streptomyces spirodelae]|uniref:C40 family peptidase n=1 Tax=Streptomyces spirodelae TaxID=2812904 RepID=A0ABS3WUM3_9ACTN|nr:NlpC/P60 family protein [Streptomyces spirodelae]MBO8186744.1 C40 family peptidase [Streptomyces spirodelae]
MASHRKPKPYPLAVPFARAAFTLVLAGTAGVTSFQGSGHAQPRPQPETADRAANERADRSADRSADRTAAVEAEVDRLHRDAERATEAYNGAREKTRAARRELETLHDEAARRQEKLNASRDALGSYAAAQYRDGSGVDPAVRLALSSSPADYLDRAATVERAGDLQAAAVKRTAARTRQLAQVRKEAADVSAELEKSAERASRHKRAVQSKLGRAQHLLNRLTPKQRAAVLDGHHPTSRNGERDRATAREAAPRRGQAARSHTSQKHADHNTGPAAPAAGQPATGRSARAVAFARSALGKPYVWGGTGPTGYDCSGLTQAAWKAAGVSLPRTTYSQIHAGKRVSRGNLAPGDLVFFYDSVSHVGLYIGGGRMIHAPRPGTAVRVAPIDQMPFAGAVRPA